jgi:hypothetical protein
MPLFAKYDLSTGDTLNVEKTLGSKATKTTVPALSGGKKNKTREIKISKINTTVNSYGEIEVLWKVVDEKDLIDHFMVVCNFQGVEAPIGVLAKLRGVNNYTFIDQETSSYVGTRRYLINAVLKSGNILKFDKVATHKKLSNIPAKLVTKSYKKSPRENPGIRNDPQTSGKFDNEKPVNQRNGVLPNSRSRLTKESDLVNSRKVIETFNIK